MSVIIATTTRLVLPVALVCLASCKIQSEHLVETRHEIKPIDINVNVRVERELDDFFQDLDEASMTVDGTEDDLSNADTDTTSETAS